CGALTPREKEDPAGGLDELMAVPRRSRWEPTLSVFPNQLRVGDRFTDAEGEWEVASRPVGFKQGHEVRARVRRPGAPGLRHGARIGAEALRDQAADFVELDALADRLQRGQGAGVQQHVYRIAARGALAGERREPREERMADLVRRHHRERQAVLVDHGVDDLALAFPDLRESIEHVPVAEHAAGLVEVAPL